MKASPLPFLAARRLAWFALLLELALPTVAAQFEDVTTTVGLQPEKAYCLGAAWGDYNKDGFLDFYITVGGGASRPNAFYRNNGNGTFTRVGSEAGPIVTDAHDSQGCHWADFNNDGYLDLFVNNGFDSPSPNDFYWNNGDGTFRRGTVGNLTQLSRVRSWSTCADYNLDGLLDVYVGETSSLSSGSWNLRVYRGTEPGTFTSFDLGQASFANDGAWGDFDGDGDADLFLSNAFATSRLWRNDRTQLTPLDTIGLPGAGSAVAHAAWADFDRDGDLDIALGRVDDVRIYRNEGGTNFVHFQTLAGPIAVVAWADYDNDGWVDLLVAGGQNTPRVARLYRNDGTTFSSVTEAFTQTPDSWLGCPWGDFDNDGFMDVLFTHQSGNNRMFRNRPNGNHWIKVKLTGTASNRDAIGAKVRVLATIGGQAVWQMQELNGGYGIQNDPRLNFGLGDATEIDLLRIEWPLGNVQEFPSVAVDQILTISEQTFITPARPSSSLGGSVSLTRNSLTGASYQWRREGVDLVGQTNRILNLTNITADMAGRYSIVVSNATTLATNSVYFAVDTQFTKITQGPVVTDSEDSWGSVWVDYDQDGDVDLFVANGLFTGNQLNALYRNEGNGSFIRMTADSVGDIADERGGWGQAAWSDYDNDGLPDALVVGVNGTALYRNLGQGMFERRLDLVPASWPSGPGPCFADFDNDGWVDWFISSAVLGNPVRTNALYRNLAGQAFAPVTDGPVVRDTLPRAEGSSWGDYDGDGDLDLLVATPSSGLPVIRLYENLGGGILVRAHTVGLENALGADVGAVNVSWADYDNDGRLDVFVAVYNGPNALFHNQGGGVFTHQRLGKVGQQYVLGTWADYDNDGWLDLFMAQGQGTGDPNLLWHNNGDGTFTQVTTGTLVTERGNSEGAAWGDYDNDGFMDLFVANGFVNGRNFLYRNNGNGRHWLKVILKGTTSNRSAIGAKVKVRATINGRTFWQMREVPGGNRCQDDLRPNFGLGNATFVSMLRIEWPSGTVQEFTDVAADQILSITEPRRSVVSVTTVSTTRVEGSVRGDPNTSYQVEVSTDLGTWESLGEITTDVAGSGAWLEVNPPAGTPRFYRAKGGGQ